MRSPRNAGKEPLHALAFRCGAPSVIVPGVIARLATTLPSLAALTSALLLATHARAQDSAEQESTETESGGAEERSTEAAKDDEPNGAADEDKASDAAGADDDFGHFGQFGLRVGLNGGLRMVLRYDESPLCREFDPAKGEDQPRFCGHMAPFALDLGLSFAMLDWFEPFAWARLGLGPEKETDTKALVILGVGARIYTMSDSAFKIFLEPALGLELEKGRGVAAYQVDDSGYKQDFIFHLAGGPQLDFSRYVGAYLSFGVTTGVVRAIHSSLDAQLGVQGRYP